MIYPPERRCRPDLELKRCKCGALGTPFGIGPPAQVHHEQMCRNCFDAHPIIIARKSGQGPSAVRREPIAVSAPTARPANLPTKARRPASPQPTSDLFGAP